MVELATHQNAERRQSRSIQRFKKARDFLEAIRVFAEPVFELYPPAGLAFGAVLMIANVSINSPSWPTEVLDSADKLARLQMTEKVVSTDNENIEGLIHITRRCPWYIELADMVLRRHQVTSPHDHPNDPPLRGLLVDLYSKLLEYQMASVVASRRRKFRAVVTSAFRARDWVGLLSNIKSLEAELVVKAGLSIQKSRLDDSGIQR